MDNITEATKKQKVFIIAACIVFFIGLIVIGLIAFNG